MGKCDDESAACKQDMKDYNDAEFDRQTAIQSINQLSDDFTQAKAALAAALSVTAGGVAVGLATSWTGVGLIVGIVVGVGGAAATLALSLKVRDIQDRLDKARQDCAAARLRMKQAYDKSLTARKEEDCRPSATIAACP